MSESEDRLESAPADRVDDTTETPEGRSAPRHDSIPPPPRSVVSFDTLTPPRHPNSEYPLPDFGDAGSSPLLDGRLRIPRAPRSLPPMPEVGPILDDADAARERGDWDAALEVYKKALFVLDNSLGVEDRAKTQASIYASIAEVKLAQEKYREAETNFEKALAIDPKHSRSLGGLVSAAARAKDWERLAAVHRRRADAFEDGEDKAIELCRVADLEANRLGSVEKAIATLEIASIHSPDDTNILVRLRGFYEKTHAWRKLFDVLGDLVRNTTEPRRRGSLRFGQADIALGRFREEPRGLALLEMALDEDPQCDRALSALVAVRTRREEWLELAAIYERLVDRYAGLEDRDRAWEVCRKLGTLRRDRLVDGPGALEAFRGAVELRPDDVETRAALAELYAAKGERALAVRELETVALRAPLRAQTYRRLTELHQRAQRPDRAWLAATCLEELGASDVSHDLVIEQFRPDGPIRPTTALDGSWWELLTASGADPIVSDILLTVGPTAIELRLEELEAKKKLPPLDPERKHDKTSTASAVRTFVWAAKALSTPLPDLYVLDVVPNGVAAVPARVPSTALGPSALSGRTVQQLAFIAGRHLTYFLPAHYPLVFFPTLAELSTLVLTAVSIVIPGISVPPAPDGESRTFSALSQRLSDEQRTKLEEIVGRLDQRGGTLDLLQWIRSVELTAARAGLLLAGDLRIASRMMNDEQRTIGELSAEAKRGDLLAFTASEAYGILRERMGVSIHSAALSSGVLPPVPSEPARMPRAEDVEE